MMWSSSLPRLFITEGIVPLLKNPGAGVKEEKPASIPSFSVPSPSGIFLNRMVSMQFWKRSWTTALPIQLCHCCGLVEEWRVTILCTSQISRSNRSKRTEMLVKLTTMDKSSQRVQSEISLKLGQPHPSYTL